MRINGKLHSLRDLAWMNVEDWIGLINKKQVVDGAVDSSNSDIIGFPPDVPGKDQEEKINNYANVLVSTIQDAFPTQVIAHHISSDNHLQGKDDLEAFFAKNSDFDFRTTYIEKYVRQKSAFFDEVKDKENLKQNLESLQRIFKLTPHYSHMSTLLADGLNSAYAITNIGQSAFIQKYSNSLGGTAQAKIIYENAVQTSSMALNLLVSYSPMFNGVGIAALPSNVLPQMNQDIPDWETLFGSLASSLMLLNLQI